MIQGLSALLPILNKAVSLVPDKNKIAQQKADLEKELVKALVDVDKEQAKINREDAKATGKLSWIQRLWRPTLAWICVMAFGFQFLVIPITTWYGAITSNPINLPTLPSDVLMTTLFALLGLTGARSFEKLKKIDKK
jgi:hypothetical protein|tara:strand:- start:743 stop:1153 length:411 start_codon:yes stop_codon:yes gene_type:complete